MGNRVASLALTVLFALLAAVGCSPGSETGVDGTGAGAGTGDVVGSSSNGFGQNGTGTGQTTALTISPLDPTLDVVYGTPGQSIQFTAKDANGNAVNPVWFLNTPEAGTIDASGNFVSNGQAGGEVLVTAKLGTDVASTTIHIHLSLTENPGNLLPADIATLDGAGMPEAGFGLVYPYDKTVFPRAIVSPQIHPQGGAAAAAYRVQFSVGGCEYKGYFNATPQIAMTQAAWDAIGTCTDGTDTTVEIAKLAGGQKLTTTQTWRIAKGKLHGVIYYNTYNSVLGGTAAMMRINGNSAVPEVLVGNCTVCHSVSSDGSTAAAANHGGGIGGIFDLTSGMVNPPNIFSDSEIAAFAALYPQGGSVWVKQGAPGSGYPPNTPGTGGPYTSDLRTREGVVIPNSGIESYYAQSPVFSHDGKHLAFTDRNPNDLTSVLAVLDYDAATQKFSNYRALAAPDPGRHYSWPAFTPDNNWIVVQDGLGDDLATWSGNTAKLRAFNLTTGARLDLGLLNGDGYMPQGARDENLNYEPTILPIAAGGYFWVMFTSRRTYGSVLTGDYSVTKRLWVAAFDANADGTTDPSHPAFYISGQEIDSGNSRGFWALPPCQDVGNACTSGDECCGGYCNPDPNDPSKFTCGTPDGECSAEFENCNTAADCCDPSLQCIGGKCSLVPPA